MTLKNRSGIRRAARGPGETELSAAPTLGYEFSSPAEFALFINERVYQNIDTFKFGSELPQIEPSPSSQLSHEASARLA